MSVGERPGRAVALASKNRTAAAQQDSLWRPEDISSRAVMGNLVVRAVADAGHTFDPEPRQWANSQRKSHERGSPVRRFSTAWMFLFPASEPATRHSSGAPPRVASGRPSVSGDIAGIALEASNRRADARVARGTLGPLAETSAPTRAVACVGGLRVGGEGSARDWCARPLERRDADVGRPRSA